MLTEREKEIFELIESNRNISIPEIATTLYIPVATVNCTLRSLKHKGYIRRNDPGMSNDWIVLK